MQNGKMCVYGVRVLTRSAHFRAGIFQCAEGRRYHLRNRSECVSVTVGITAGLRISLELFTYVVPTSVRPSLQVRLTSSLQILY
jgi:hypothetical protein